jgi:hypothetical protein
VTGEEVYHFLKNIVIVNLVVVAYKPEFNQVFPRKLKYNSIMHIDSETPDVMPLWMKFFCSEDRIERVLSE